MPLSNIAILYRFLDTSCRFSDKMKSVVAKAHERFPFCALCLPWRRMQLQAS